MNSLLCNGEPFTPSKIVCIGRNYVAHIEELGNAVPEDMVVFLKPNSAISEQLHARIGEVLHYEAELSFMVEHGRLIAAGVGLDLTKRGLQSKLKESRLPWERAKAFDGAAVFSHFTRVADAALSSLRFELTVDGELRQSGIPSLMMYKPATIVRKLVKFMSLEDGDVIMTGTPAGVGEIIAGQQFCAKVYVGDDVVVEHQWVAQ